MYESCRNSLHSAHTSHYQRHSILFIYVVFRRTGSNFNYLK
nr:MAG TPA: hypothetical protein [Caudoviricetes sp.]